MFTPQQLADGLDSSALDILTEDRKLAALVVIFYINTVLLEEMLEDNITKMYHQRQGNGFSIALNAAATEKKLFSDILVNLNYSDIVDAIEEYYFNYGWYIDISSKKSALGHWALMMNFQRIGSYGGQELFDEESEFSSDNFDYENYYKKKAKMVNVFKHRKKLTDWGGDGIDLEEELNDYAFIEVAGDDDLKSKHEKALKKQKEEDDLFELEV